MSKFVRIALLVALGVLAAANAAMAVVPDPTFCSVGPCLVVTPGGDPGLTFTVQVNDQFNTPINGSNVVVKFTDATGVTLCSGQDAPASNVSGDLTATTGVSGTIVFTPRGNGSFTGTVRVFADGVQIGTVADVHTCDLVADYNMDISDVATMGYDLSNGVLEVDLNCDGVIDVSDVALFAENMILSSGGFCP